MAYALINKLTARSGQRERVAALLLESGRLFDDNSSCELYAVAESVDDPDTIWVLDRWTSKEEHEAALRRPELRPFVDQTVPLLVAMPEQTEIRIIGGKGV